MLKKYFATITKVIPIIAVTALMFSCSDVDDDGGRFGLNPDNISSPTNPTSVPGTPWNVWTTVNSSSSITVSWSSVSGATGYYVYRSTSSSGTFSYITSTSSTSWTNTGLSSNTTYWYRVAAYNSRGTGSQSSSVSATTLSSGSTGTQVFSENFDGSSHGFTLVNGSQTNQWRVGTAARYSGTRSAYISNNNGTSNAYTITTSSTVHMYRDITFPASSTSYRLTFRWRAQGESCCDYLRVFLVPTTTTPTAGSQLSSSNQIGNSYNMGGSTTWNLATINIPAFSSSTTRRLVFSWHNDSSVGTMPPAAIDDIVITR